MTRERPWTPDDDARLRALYSAGESRLAIARVLERTVPAISGRAKRLGLTAPKPPAWTPADDARLLELLDNHTPYDRIAQQLGRTRTAIILRIKRCGYERLTRANGWSLSKVAKVVLGSRHGQKTVAWWVQERWLRATWSGANCSSAKGRPAKIHVVEFDDLVAFLEREDCWHLWQPERIVDPDLRAWALELRQGKRFLTVGQVAQRLAYSVHWVNTCILRGWLRAVKHGPNWLVREDWLPDRRDPSARWTCIVRCPICGAELGRRSEIATNDKLYHAGDVVGDLLGVACRQWAHNAFDFGVATKLEWAEERHQVGRVNRRPRQHSKIVRLPAAVARELAAVGV